jgi:isopenicillin-N N-acyltransferase like protein
MKKHVFYISKKKLKMTSNKCLQLTALCFFFFACNSATTKDKNIVPKQVESINDNVPVLELSGNGYQRGLQHGKALKIEIAEVFSKWKNSIQNETHQNADTVLAAFIKDTNFEPAIRKHTPEIYNEIKGIAESSGQSFYDVLTFQLVDEFWVYLDKIRNTKKHHCSGIGIAGADTHPAYVSQNMDLETYMNGYQTLLYVASSPNEPEQYILSCAGLVALNGVNSRGIGLCVNTLMELNASIDGLPVACIVRGVLAQNDIESALNFLKSVPHASGQNYIFGAFNKVYDFEASSNKVVRYLPNAKNEALVYHTNHAMANDDVKPWFQEEHKKVMIGEMKNDNSVVRFTSLENRLTGVANNLSEDKIKETLRSKDDLINPVCVTYTKDKFVFTFSSVIYTLGENPTIQLTNGSPDQADYVLHTFNQKVK